MTDLLVPFVVHVEDPNSWKVFEQLRSVEAFSKFCSIPLQFRLINRRENDVQWEDEAPSLDLTVKDFSNWVDGSGQSDSLLKDVSSKDFALYAAYQYMHETFSDCPDLLTLIDWSQVGLTGRGPSETTLWLGSAGAMTPGHYDTYGCNVVAQLAGSKRWCLFPPHQTACLYPTRQPYEESSVFSQCSLDQQKNYPMLQDSTPYVVDLSPGDLLYVPPKWWHFVSCKETALSINTWIDIPSLDNVARVEEALVRWLVSTRPSSDIRVNYTEKVPLAADESEKFLEAAVTLARSVTATADGGVISTIAATLAETAKRNGWQVDSLKPMNYGQFLEKYHSSKADNGDDDVDNGGSSDEDADDNESEDAEAMTSRSRGCVLDAILSPDVISLAAAKLINDARFAR